MKNNRTLARHIPDNFDIKKLIEQHPPNFEINIDEVHFIVGMLNEIPSYDTKTYCSLADWIPLNAQVIRECGIRNFPQIRDWLIESKVIQCDNHYIVKGTYSNRGKLLKPRSKHFRFTEEYRTAVHKIAITKRNLIKKYHKRSKEDIESERKYKSLKSWFNGLEIDANAAEDYLYNIYIKNSKGNKSINLRKFNIGVLTIDKIKNKDFHFTVDTTAGRLHTNLTNLKSELRNFIRYKGKELISIDIKNSQPVLSTVLFQPKFFELGSSRCQNIFSLLLNNKEILNTRNNLSSIMLSLQSQHTDKQDIRQYIEYCRKGTLYDEMLKQLIAKGLVNKETTRKEIKPIMFSVLFSSNMHNDKLKTYFKELFPNIYEVFVAIKKNGKEKLPILLQRIESELMLEMVSKRITRERKSLPIFTIHDSIVTTKGNEDYVAQIMKEEFFNLIGITPSLEIEHLSSQLLYRIKDAA